VCRCAHRDWGGRFLPLAGRGPLANQGTSSAHAGGAALTCGSKNPRKLCFRPYDGDRSSAARGGPARSFWGKDKLRRVPRWAAPNENSAYGPVRNPESAGIGCREGRAVGSASGGWPQGLAVVSAGAPTLGGSIRQTGFHSAESPAMMPSYGPCVLSRYGLIAFCFLRSNRIGTLLPRMSGDNRYG